MPGVTTLRIKVKTTGIKELIGSLKRIRKQIVPRTVQTLDINGQYLQAKVLDQFQREGMPRWAALSHRYREWKAQMGFDTKILSRTHLMQQLIYYHRKSGVGAQISGEVTIPEGAVYPNLIQGGTRMGSFKEAKQYSAKRGRRVRGKSRVISVAKVAGYHENGTGRMPARMIFAPVAIRERRHVFESFRKMIASIVQ